MTKEQYTIGDNELDFHQFSFTSYDDSIDDWKNGVVIAGNNIPARIEGDQITMVINEPNINNRPWYQSQTDLLISFYKPHIEPLAKKYGLTQLHISIEPNQYGSVMLAFTTSISQRDQLQSMLARVFMNGAETRDQLGYDYEDFIIAHFKLNGEWDHIRDYDTAEEYVGVMKEATETAGYIWDDDAVEEHTGYWNEANQEKVTA